MTGPASPTRNASRRARRRSRRAAARDRARLPMDHDTFIVLVTRGHSHDVECLLEVLDRPVAYIGMIGSQRRVDAVFELLENEMGIDPRKFDRVYAPIGIAIGARTPAEIAVCIMAEMINVLRGGPGDVDLREAAGAGSKAAGGDGDGGAGDKVRLRTYGMR